MFEVPKPAVAIVDYGLGNLFSVKHACEQAGMHASITHSCSEILQASAVILPGVGAFGDAMEMLDKLDLVRVLQDIAASGKPLVGICLGMQLLLTESHEFGRHRGLGVIEGEVIRLEEAVRGVRVLKVPHVGWNRIHAANVTAVQDDSSVGWERSLLEGLSEGEYMYFVHSFYPKPVDVNVVLSITHYGPVDFSSSLRLGNVFGCQFHPERSGLQGLRLYHNLGLLIQESEGEPQNVRTAGGKV